MKQEKERCIKKLKKLAEKYGVDWDLIDWEAIYDTKISFDENYEILEDYIKQMSSTKNVKTKIEADKKEKNAVKHEMEEKARLELEAIKKEEKFVKSELDKSINEIKIGSTKELDNAFKVPNELIKTMIKAESINGVILWGSAGKGKTFNTIKTLKGLNLEIGKDYEMLASYVTPLEFYKFLYENRNEKILILDDTKSFFNNPINQGLVLACLWNEGKRIVHYLSSSGKLKNIPQSFIFNSKIIWCCNELPKDMEAVKSRCFYYELDFNYSTTLKLMYGVAKLKSIPFEVVDFIKENTDESTRDFDFRLLFKIYEIYNHNKDWKEISKSLLGLNKDEKLTLLKTFLDESNSIKEAQQKWSEETGNSRATFFAKKSQLLK